MNDDDYGDCEDCSTDMLHTVHCSGGVGDDDELVVVICCTR